MRVELPLWALIGCGLGLLILGMGAGMLIAYYGVVNGWWWEFRPPPHLME